MRILMWLVAGAISGWLASVIMDMPKGGLIKTITIGIIGSIVGGCIFSVIGFYAYGLFANIITSLIGACLFLYVAKKIFKW